VRNRDRDVVPGLQQFCGRSSIATQDKTYISEAINDAISRVSTATGGALNLEVKQTHLTGELALSRVPGGCNWWFGPGPIGEIVGSYLTADDTDGVVIIGREGLNTGAVPIGSGSYSVDASGGVKGAPWSAVDIGTGNSEPASTLGIKLVSVFGDQFVSALKLGITDPRGTAILGSGDTFPACKAPTTAYFPSLDSCTMDPDYAACGAANCSDLGAYQTHALQSHYNPAWTVIGNHCRDGKKDIDESGVDCGGNACNPCN
jgi:hypothetical protein